MVLPRGDAPEEMAANVVLERGTIASFSLQLLLASSGDLHVTVTDGGVLPSLDSLCPIGQQRCLLSMLSFPLV